MWPTCSNAHWGAGRTRRVPPLLRRMLLVLLALVVVAGPLAPHASAQAISTVACLSTATPASASNVISFDAFVPNAGCWIKATFQSIKSFGIMKLMAQMGQFAVMLMFFINFFNGWISRSIGGMFRAVVMAVVASVLVNDAMVGGSITNRLYTLPMEAWTKVYVSSNGLVSKFMTGPGGVEAQTKDMAATILDFTSYAFMGVNSMGSFKVGSLFDSRNDPAALQEAATSASDVAFNEAQQRITNDRANIERMTWVFQLGYLLLLSFFMAFSGMMYLSAMSVVIGMFALPLAIAIWGGGSSRPFQYIVTTWAVAIATAGIAPVMMAIATQLALNEPTKYMKSQIAPLTATAKTQLDSYKTIATSCTTSMSNVAVGASGPAGAIAGTIKPFDNALAVQACTGLSGLVPLAKGLGNAIFQILIGFAIMVVTMSVTMAVGVQLLRSIPSLLSSIFGGIGVAGNTPTLMGAANGAASTAAMFAGGRSGGGGGGGSGNSLGNSGAGGMVRAAGGALGGATVGAGRMLSSAAQNTAQAAGNLGNAGRSVGAGLGVGAALAGNAMSAAANSKAGQTLAASPAGQAVKSAANSIANSPVGQGVAAGANRAAAGAGQLINTAASNAASGLAAAKTAGQTALNSAPAQGAINAGRVAAANMSAAYTNAQQNGGALRDSGVAGLAAAAASGAAEIARGAASGASSSAAGRIDQASGKAGELGLRSANASQAAKDAMDDQTASRTQAVANSAAGNNAPDSQGRTGQEAAYHQLASQGNLPSQQRTDNARADSVAAAHNAQEQSKAAQNPNYTPQPMSRDEAKQQLAAAGKNSAADYAAAQGAKPRAAESRELNAQMQQDQARAWSDKGNIDRRKAAVAAQYDPSSSQAAHNGNPTVQQAQSVQQAKDAQREGNAQNSRATAASLTGSNTMKKK